MFKEVHLDAPNVGEQEKNYLNKAIDSGYVSTIGPFVPEFEKSCTDYLKISGSVSTNSGTSALHMALHELGIGKGDEVIVPALTFVGTINPVLYTGAAPVLVDVDPETWNIDPKAFEEAITEKTKAVIPVHLYGNPCDMKAINNIAKRHDIYVIEDASESLGARYGDRFTGTLGDLGCFSFNGNKTITTGGGGLVVGNNMDALDHIRFLVNQANDGDEERSFSEVGFNFRMTNLQAALGLAQIERLEEFLLKKRTFNAIYNEALKGIESVCFQAVYVMAESSYWFTCIAVEDEISRVELQKKLKGRGVPTRRVFKPLSEMPPYRKFRFIDNGNSKHIYERGICLPGSTLNSVEDIKHVCEAIKESCGANSIAC